MTKIFGILNVTPDSFSDGGKYYSPASALKQAKKLFRDGADFVDVGGESTNPKSESISSGEEWKRLESILPQLVKSYPGKVSIDTMNPDTAKKFIDLGGKIINDVSGFQDPEMIKLAAKSGSLNIINHFPGIGTKDVHSQRVSSKNQVMRDLLNKRGEMIAAGIKPFNIILDPGIGFGKTPGTNLELLTFASLVPDIPVMIGFSRKRFLGKNRFKSGPNRKAGQIAIESGAAYLRVHEPSIYSRLL